MSNLESAKQLLQVCVSIGEFEPKKEELIRRHQWGDINFEQVGGEIDTVFWLVEETKKLPIHIIPDKIVQNAANQLTNVHGILAEIDRFTLFGRT